MFERLRRKKRSICEPSAYEESRVSVLPTVDTLPTWLHERNLTLEEFFNQPTLYHEDQSLEIVIENLRVAGQYLLMENLKMREELKRIKNEKDGLLRGVQCLAQQNETGENTLL